MIQEGRLLEKLGTLEPLYSRSVAKRYLEII